MLGNRDLGIVYYSSRNLLTCLIEVYFIVFKLDKWGKVLHYLKHQRKKAAPGKYHEYFFTKKSTSDKDLTDHEIEKKQDYCINRSEHRGKLNIVQIRKITKQLPVVSEFCYSIILILIVPLSS